MSTKSTSDHVDRPAIPVDANVRIRRLPSFRNLRALSADSDGGRSDPEPRGYTSDTNWRTKSGRFFRRALSPLDTFRRYNTQPRLPRRRSPSPRPDERRATGRRLTNRRPELASILRSQGERRYDTYRDRQYNYESSRPSSRASSIESMTRRRHRERSYSPASTVSHRSLRPIADPNKLDGPIQILAAGLLHVLRNETDDIGRRASRHARHIAKLKTADILGVDAFGLEEDAEEELDPASRLFDRDRVGAKDEGADTRTFSMVQSHLRANHQTPYTSVHDRRANRFIPDLIEYSNLHGLSIKQVRTLAYDRLEGKLAQGLASLTRQHGLLTALERLASLLHTPQEIGNYDGEIRKWRLDLDKPIRSQLKDLEILYVASSTDESAESIALLVRTAALRDVPLHIKSKMDEVTRAYRRMFRNKTITTAWFARELQKLINVNLKADSKSQRVRTVREDSKPITDSDDVRQTDKFLAMQNDLRTMMHRQNDLTEQLSRTLAMRPPSSPPTVTYFDAPPPRLGHHDNAYIRNTFANTPPNQTTSNPQPNGPGNSSHYGQSNDSRSYRPGGNTVDGTPRTDAYGGARQRRPDNYDTQTGYVSGTPIERNSTAFKKAVDTNSWWAFDRMNSSGEAGHPTHEWKGKYYRPLGGDVPQVPHNMATFVQTEGKSGTFYRINPDILRMFRNRCPMDGLVHKRGGLTCPYKDMASSWDLCPKCRQGYHASCLLDPALRPN